MIKKSKSLIAAGAMVLGTFGFSPNTTAQILLQDNFDSYANQAAFEAVWTLVGTPALPSGTLSTAQAVSLPNSISYSTAAQRNERSFTESGNPSQANIITWSFDFYDSDASASPYRQFANLQDGTAPGAGGQLISMGLNNNLSSAADGGNYYMARILGLDGGTGVSAYFKLNDVGAPLRSTGWHNLSVQISDTEFEFYVDGILSQTVANTALLRSYDVVRLGSGLTSVNGAAFDNVVVSVAPIPEPSTIALGLIGGAGLMVGYFRRRAKK